MMPNRCWTLLAALFWLRAACLPLSAGTSPRYSVKTWDTESGLPQNAVLSMVQTHDSYLWLGTGYGLARFDGLHFTPFDANSAPGLDGKVVKLFEDSRHNLWIGTETSGVVLVDAAGHVSTVTLGAPSTEGPLRYICEDSTGAVWLCMSRGQLYRYWQGKAVAVADNCRALDVEDGRLVWVGTPNGRLIGLGPMVQAAVAAIPVSYEITLGKVDYLLTSARGGYWRLAAGRIQKCKADKVEKDFGPYPWKEGAPILTACEDLSGNLIVGLFDAGVYWFDAQGKAIRIEGLSQRTAWSLMVDREGNLWVGTNGGGLDRVKRQEFQLLTGTEELTVQSVCAPARGDQLWIGYNEEHVDHWTGSSLEHFTNLWPGAPAALPSQTRVAIHSMFVDSQGQVWAGGASSLPGWPCLFRYESGQFSPVIPGPFHQDVSAIYQDPQGQFWLGTQNGLALWTNREWKLFTTRQGLPADYIRAIAGDAEGSLWVGTAGGGVARLRDGQFTTFRTQGEEGPPSDDISSLYLDREGALWVGTAGGLSRFAHGKWTRYTTHEGLASNKVGYLLEDDAGFLWMGSNRGLMRVPKKSLTELAEGKPGPVTCRVFGTSDGLPTGECSAGSQPGACRTADGQLWFPTIKGLVHVRPSLLVPNTNPPPVIIEAVKVDDQFQGSDSLRAPAPKEVIVPADKESLEIFYTSLSFSAPELGRFKYRLRGHETTWTERAGTVRSARYIKLPRGDYVFEVKACNEDGVESATSATLAVSVLPAFWQTTWFIGLSSLIVLALIVGSVYYVSTQKLQRQLAALRQQEALEKERARIARDLHDQLGANLTQVALLGEMAESDKALPEEVEGHARQISQTARETTRALDEIVWTVNPSNDTLDGLINYVCKYAQEYLALAGLRYRLEVPPQLPALPISPEVRHNLFLTTKEAVNNVVKHAQATCAWLRLKLEAGHLVLEIEDNGRGIAASDEAKGRSGLRNMRKRIEEVGGEFAAEPGAEGGTCIRITVDLQDLSANQANGRKEKVIRATVRQGGGDGGSR